MRVPSFMRCLPSLPFHYVDKPWEGFTRFGHKLASYLTVHSANFILTYALPIFCHRVCSNSIHSSIPLLSLNVQQSILVHDPSFCIEYGMFLLDFHILREHGGVSGAILPMHQSSQSLALRWVRLFCIFSLLFVHIPFRIRYSLLLRLWYASSYSVRNSRLLICKLGNASRIGLIISKFYSSHL